MEKQDRSKLNIKCSPKQYRKCAERVKSGFGLFFKTYFL